MSEIDTSTEDTPAQEERKASPISGCLIFVILIAVFTFLGAAIVWNYLDTQKAVMVFSQEQQATVDEARPSPRKIDALTNKLNTFSDKVKKGEVAHIELSAEEINISIAKFQKMEEFKGKMFITEIKGQDNQAEGTENRYLGSIHADVAFPVNSGFNERRFLNGTIEMLPSIEQGSLFPTITKVNPATGSDFPEKMTRFLPQALFSSYRNDPDLVAVFHKLSTVELHDDKMIITSDPNFKPVIKAEASDGIHNLLTGLSIFGILFFILFSTAVMIYWIRKRNKQAKAEANS